MWIEITPIYDQKKKVLINFDTVATICRNEENSYKPETSTLHFTDNGTLEVMEPYSFFSSVLSPLWRPQ